MPKRADAIAQRLVLIACPGRIAIRLDQWQDLGAYRPFGGRPLHGRIIGTVHRRSRADNVLLEEGEFQSVHVDEQRFVGDVVFAMSEIFAHVERSVKTLIPQLGNAYVGQLGNRHPRRVDQVHLPYTWKRFWWGKR